MGVASIAALIGPPINGALIESYGGFDQVSYLSGTSSLVGGLFVLGSKMVTPEGLFGRV
jgi:hypothetical protein